MAMGGILGCDEDDEDEDEDDGDDDAAAAVAGGDCYEEEGADDDGYCYDEPSSDCYAAGTAERWWRKAVVVAADTQDERLHEHHTHCLHCSYDLKRHFYSLHQDCHISRP